MIEYRHNKLWGSESFSVDKTYEIDDAIKKNAERVRERLNVKHLEIIDVQIRSTMIPETSRHYQKLEHYITLFYTYSKKSEKKYV